MERYKIDRNIILLLLPYSISLLSHLLTSLLSFSLVPRQANMPVFNQSPQLAMVAPICLFLSFSFYRCIFHPLIPNVSFNLYHLFSLIWTVHFSPVFFFSSALPETESQHRNTVITQAENCNSRKICLLFGLVVLNPNELSDSAGKKKLSLIPVRVICTMRK